MSERPKTAAAVMSLPEFEIPARRIVVRCKCGREHTISIPFLPELLASYVGADDIIAVTDSEGITWAPIATRDGWYRRRVGG
jgi:hypothetical protein